MSVEFHLYKGGSILLDVAFDYYGYKFENVKECDVDILYKWMKENNSKDNVSSLDEQLLYRRFLEYYITEDEFFVKVLNNNRLDGIIKGSINGDNKEDLFLWYFLVDKNIRNKGEGTKIINAFSKYMCKKYKIRCIKAGVSSANVDALSFWNSLGFEKFRETKKFFQVSDTDFENLIIMNKENIAV